MFLNLVFCVSEYPLPNTVKSTIYFRNPSRCRLPDTINENKTSHLQLPDIIKRIVEQISITLKFKNMKQTRERERDRDTERDRERDTHTQRDTEGDTERHRERQRERRREGEREEIEKEREERER